MSESDQSRTFDQSASEGASSSPPYEANQTTPEAGHDASWSAPGSGSESSASQFDSTATGGASGHAGAYRPGSDSREGPDSSWGAPPPRWGQRTSFAPPANGSVQFATPGQPASQASAQWSHASDHSAPGGSDQNFAPGAGPAPQNAPRAQQWGLGDPKPGVIPLRPLQIGELFEGTFRAMRSNPSVVFGFTLVVVLIVAVITAIISSLTVDSVFNKLFPLIDQTDEDPTVLIDFILSDLSSIATNLGINAVTTTVLLTISTVLVTGVLCATVQDAVLGRACTLAEAWNQIKSRVGVLSLYGLLLSIPSIAIGALMIFVLTQLGSAQESDMQRIVIMVLVATVAALIFSLVYLFLLIRLLYVEIVIVIERSGLIDSIKRSWKLTKGSFWRTFGRYALIYILLTALVSVASGVVGAVTGLLALTGSPTILFVSSVLGTTIAQAITLPVVACFTTLMYVDERMRKENLGPALAQAARA